MADDDSEIDSVSVQLERDQREEASAARLGTFANARGDLDSVRTEDFLSEFHKTLVRDGSEKKSSGAAGGLLLNSDLSPLLTNGLRFRVPLRAAEADEDSIATENFERTFNHLLVPDLPAASHAVNADMISYRGRALAPATFSGRSAAKVTLKKPPQRPKLSNITEGFECARARRPTSPDRTEALMHNCALQSSARSSLPFGLTPREALDQKVTQLDELSSAVRTARSEKLRLVSELTHLEDSLRHNAAEVRLHAKMARNTRAETEDARAELALAELRRNRLLQSLDLLNEKLASKKEQLEELEMTLRSRVHEIQSLEAVGLSREEIDSVIRERDELFELIRASDETENEKYELEKQLTAARGEVVQEQFRSNQRVTNLQNEVEQLLTKVTSLQLERDALQKNIADLERQFDDARRTIVAKDEEVAGVREEVERCKQTSDSDLRSASARHHQELGRLQDLKLSIEGELVAKNEALAQRCGELQAELEQAMEHGRDMEAEAQRLQEALRASETELQDATKHSTELLQERRREAEEFQSRIASLSELSESNACELREELNTRRLHDLENLRSRLESAHGTELRETEEKLVHQISQLEEVVQSKTEELDSMAQLLQQRSREAEEAREAQAAEARDHLRQTLDSELQKWQREADRRLQADLSSLKAESDRQCEVLRGKLERQREKTKLHEGALRHAREEMEKERNRFGSIIDEQSAVISRMSREHEEERTKLEVLLHEKDLSLGSNHCLLSDLQEEVERQKREVENRRHVEQSAISALHAECLRLLRSLEHEAPADRSFSCPPGDLNGCVQLVEVCSKEFRNELSQLYSRLEIEKRKLAEILVTKNETIKALQEAGQRDLQTLRQQLEQKHKEELKSAQEARAKSVEVVTCEKDSEMQQLRASMQDWKKATAEKLASKMQEEFNREYERKMHDVRKSLRRREGDLASKRREVELLQAELLEPRRAPPKSRSPDPQISSSTAARTISQLQERIGALREENIALRRENLSLRSPSTASELRGSPELHHVFSSLRRDGTPVVMDPDHRSYSEVSLPCMKRNGSVEQLSRPLSRCSLRESPASVPVRD